MTSATDTSSAMDKVIDLIASVGNIPKIGPDDDLFDAGFSSVRTLQLLTELEDTFNLTIPDDQFMKARTARQLHTIIQELAQ